MRFGLCSAMARCHVRRLRRAAAGAPVPAALVTILVALAPLALWRVGRAVGTELAGVVNAGGVVDALVLGPLLAAAVAGAALAVSLPTRSALGAQVAASPGGEIAAFAAGLLVPALMSALIVLPSLATVCIALALQFPGGGVAGVALGVATVAAVPAGAILAEGVLAAARGRRRILLASAAGAVVWAAVGAMLGAAGPLAPVGAALRGQGSEWGALALAAAAALVLDLIWVALAAGRPEGRPRRARPGRRLGPREWCPMPVAVAAVVTRRGDVRLAALSALGFGAAGVAIAVAASAPAPAPFLLATTTALLGSMVCALSVCGVLVGGRWLWLGASTDKGAIVAAACCVGVVGSALPVGLVGVGAMLASDFSSSAAGVVAAVVVVGSALALIAGALVPWSGGGLGDQLSSFAAFAAIAIVASLLVGLVVPRLTSLGLPDPLAVVLVCGASIGAALAAVRRRLDGAP